MLSSVLTARQSFSIGGKFFLLFAMAVLMSIPGFFVNGMASERAANHPATIASAPQQSSVVMGIPLADSYRSTERSTKYITLFLGLVFLTYFLFELSSGRRVHPGQYALVGVAQTIFYLLLLSLAEHLGFDVAFAVAGLATVILFSVNTKWLFASSRLSLRAFGVFSLLYGFIYVLLRLENYALLVGSVASFAAVAVTMYATRSADWYARAGAAPVAGPSGGRTSWLD